MYATHSRTITPQSDVSDMSAGVCMRALIAMQEKKSILIWYRDVKIVIYAIFQKSFTR